MKISTSKINQVVSKGLENKYVLYIVLFFAITNLLGYLMIGDIRILAFFGLVGFVVSKFSKNMIIVLGTAMIATNFFLAGRKTSQVVEGMISGNKKKTKESLGGMKKKMLLDKPNVLKMKKNVLIMQQQLNKLMII